MGRSWIVDKGQLRKLDQVEGKLDQVEGQRGSERSRVEAGATERREGTAGGEGAQWSPVPLISFQNLSRHQELKKTATVQMRRPRPRPAGDQAVTVSLLVHQMTSVNPWKIP